MSSPDYLPEDYPNRISCTAMPQLEQDVTPIEIADLENGKVVLEVLSQAVRRINMPRVSPRIAGEVREPFEAGIGMGLVACRIVEQSAEALSIELPSIEGPRSLSVSPSTLARSM